ncbi:MAG: hypothetical protein HXK01_01675 [Abiotrophia sp.]|nr:hypothetical protein [Abiotrophia sp.]
MEMEKLINKVNKWFENRDIAVGDGLGQIKKLKEEVEELEDAHAANDFTEEVDAVGDITVVLIGYCLQRGLDFAECLAHAYEEIKDRTGHVKDGVFVKNE